MGVSDIYIGLAVYRSLYISFLVSTDSLSLSLSLSLPVYTCTKRGSEACTRRARWRNIRWGGGGGEVYGGTPIFISLYILPLSIYRSIFLSLFIYMKRGSGAWTSGASWKHTPKRNVRDIYGGMLIVKTRRWEYDRPGVEPTASGCTVWGRYP